MGDAGPVRGRDPGAQGGAHGCRRLRRLAHGRARGRGPDRAGYTGEEGVELACMSDDAEVLWDAILARRVTPAGLGARDTLRLEVCYPLHGNDIGPQCDAISSGLGWACALDTGFTGAER